MKLYLVPILVMLMAGCTKNPVAVHPGSISNFDSYAYDILLVEQDAITTARAQYVAGQLPAAAKPILNNAIAQYNATQAAWQSYHASGAGQSTLQQALDGLVALVGALQQALNKTPAPVTQTLEVFHVHYAYAA
jgi:N-methylhydantoinase B/oxoprolinase/acetone carboxylase alpha subunit